MKSDNFMVKFFTMKHFAALSLFIFSFVCWSQSTSSTDSLRSLIAAEKTDTSKVLLYNQLHDELRLSDFNQAAEVARKSFLLSKEIGWQKGLSVAARNYGIAKNLLGEYDSAELLIKIAMEASEATGDQQNIGYCLMTLGNIQYDQTNYDEALGYYFDCMAAYDSIDNYAGMSSALIWIGIIYQYAKSDYDAARATYKDALHYCDLGKANLNKGYVYANLATIHNELYQLDSAIYFNKLANEIKKEYDDLRGIGNGYNNIGNVFYDMQSYDSALYYYNLAEEIRVEMNDQTGMASVWSNLARVYHDLGEYEKAETLYKRAIELSRDINYKEAWQQATLLLSQLYEEQKMFKESLAYFKEYKSASDSIFNVASDRNISELQTKYETEKKEQQIALQQSEISEQQAQNKINLMFIVGLLMAVVALIVILVLARSRARKKQELIVRELELRLREAQIEAAISSQEQERTRVAQDLHDGFGQMISILNLNIKSLEKDYSNKEEVFEQSSAVLEDMYRELKGICFNLMPQTLIKNGIVSAVNEFASRVNHTGKINIETDFFGLEDRLTEVQEISLYRITQEWINNMLKYSDADRVNIQITKDEQEITLMIEDNGTGFDLESLKSGKGNGWRNMNSRANLMKGELEVDTQLGMRGSTLIVNAPVKAMTPSAMELENA